MKKVTHHGKSNARSSARSAHQPHRTRSTPHAPRSPLHAPRSTPDGPQNHALFGHCSTAWNHLTDPERSAWNHAAPRARRFHGHLAHLSGQQLFVKVNSTRLAFGLEPLPLPPTLTAAHTNPVGPLTITQHRGRPSLKLVVPSTATCPILLYASAPCNAGVSVAFKFARLGLLPDPVNGLSDITRLYLAKHGHPRPGQRIFVRTRCLENYLSAFTRTTNALVPYPTHQRHSLGTPADI